MTRTSDPLLLSKVMDLLLDVVCVVDETGHFVFVSAASERVFGYRPDELVGRNMIELVHPDDRERTLNTAAEIMRDKARPHFENRYVRKDGRVVDIMWSARWSAEGRVRLAVARDVTELRRAERKHLAVYRIAEAAHTAADLRELYQRVHEILRNLLPADEFIVAHYEEATHTLSFPHADACTQPLVPGSRIAEVIRRGRAALANASEGDTATASPAAVEDDAGDWMGVPLITRKGVTGALMLQSHATSVRYDENDRELLHFVSNQIADAIERKRGELRLQHLALHDSLTGLPNRTLFNDRFDSALLQARRSGHHLAVLYLDLDGFKQVNDNHGHETGDRLLCEVARRLAGCVRESDTIGRIGGDEFTVLLTNLGTVREAEEIAGKVATTFATPFEVGGLSLEISASIGSAVHPEHGEDREQLLRHADVRMFATKRARR